MRSGATGAPPPWLRCSAFNGTLYLVLELASMRYQGDVLRWLFAVPISAAALCTLLVLFWDPTPPVAGARMRGGGGGGGAWDTLARTVYSILEQAALVAGVSTLLEAEQRSWGTMVAVPFLVMLMIRLDDDPRRFAAARRSHIRAGGGGGGGEGLSGVVQAVLSSGVLFSSTAAALLALVAAVLLFPAARVEGHWPLRPYHPGDGPMDMLLYMVVVPFVLVLSTPVVCIQAGPRGSGALAGWRGSWITAARSVLAGGWYALILLALRRVPSLVSWMGVPLLVTSSCLLLDSFRGWTTNLRFAWAMAATMLGLALAGEGLWWARFAVVATTGLFRVCLLAVGPYALEAGAGGYEAVASTASFPPLLRLEPL